MKILYLNQQFQTPAGGSISRGYEFMKLLAHRGHEISILCSGIDTEPELAVKPGRISSENTVDELHCVSVAAGWGSPMAITKVSKYQRMLGFLKFSRVAAKVGRRLQRPDIVMASSPPLPVGLAGRKIAQHHGVPYVFEVRDPWPSALINLQLLSNPGVIAWMRWMERRIQSAASACIALSPPIRDELIEQGFSADRVVVVPNACDLGLFGASVDRAEVRRKLGIGDRFTAIYFGAMGLANGLDYLLDAAKHLKELGQDDIAVLMVGAGGERERLAERITKEQLGNVVLRDPVSRSEIASYVAACDVGLTIIRPSVESPTWSPNKLFDCLAAGKPAVINVKGWLKELVESNNVGRMTSPTDPTELADALIELASNPALCSKLGTNARQLAENEFSREKLAIRMEQALLDLAQHYEPAHA